MLVIAISPIAWSVLQPQPKALSPDEIPDHFPVLGLWRDSAGRHCRAFSYPRPRSYANQLPTLKFFVQPTGLPTCSQSFESYNATGVQPDDLPWAGGIPGAAQVAILDVEELDSQAIAMVAGVIR